MTVFSANHSACFKIIGLIAFFSGFSSTSVVAADERCPSPKVDATKLLSSQAPPPSISPVTIATKAKTDLPEDGFPKWRDFPPPPTNIPLPSDIKAEVVKLTASQFSLNQSLAKLKWDQGEPEALARHMRSEINTTYLVPIEVYDCQATLAFGDRLHQQSLPPPLIDKWTQP
jgi:hypothetical protein